MTRIAGATVPRQQSILLLGPTGTGKTPLGDLLAERGWQGQPCLHFDFGMHLRESVARNQPDEYITLADLEFLRGVLRSGALLEDRHFPLAAQILRRFLATRGGRQAWLVLNGLPRHVGQARAMESLVEVRMLICLECSAETVRKRIGTNVGGDRAERTDDDPALVQRKLDVYHQRTAPLVEYYRSRGAAILTVPVTAEMTADDFWQAVCAAQP